MKKALGLRIEAREMPRNEMITRDEFYSLAGRKLIQKEQALKAFALFDPSEKGVVILEDLQRVASELGEELTVVEMEEMIREVDQSGEGLLTTEDFVKIANVVGL